jgi:hypothetical protein
LRCAAITKGGSRCKLDTTHGSYCYQHSPETVEGWGDGWLGTSISARPHGRMP